MAKKTCVIVGCDNDISERSESKICSTCRSSFYYWYKKRPAEIQARKERLAKYQDRFNYLTRKG